jgi:hypothetical protein
MEMITWVIASTSGATIKPWPGDVKYTYVTAWCRGPMHTNRRVVIRGEAAQP